MKKSKNDLVSSNITITLNLREMFPDIEGDGEEASTSSIEGVLKEEIIREGKSLVLNTLNRKWEESLKKEASNLIEEMISKEYLAEFTSKARKILQKNKFKKPIGYKKYSEEEYTIEEMVALDIKDNYLCNQIPKQIEEIIEKEVSFYVNQLKEQHTQRIFMETMQSLGKDGLLNEEINKTLLINQSNGDKE